MSYNMKSENFVTYKPTKYTNKINARREQHYIVLVLNKLQCH